MICDDSATVRGALSRLLAADPALRLVGQAANGRQLLDMLGAMPVAERPQVVLLDLEMPVMDGMTALPLILRAVPGVAVIVASALSQRGAAATMQALAAGAVDYIPKPSAAAGGIGDPRFREELVAKVKGWARMRGRAGRPAPRPAPVAASRPAAGRPRILAVGSSTGGPQALAALVASLRQALPVPLLVVQHMPAGFTAMLAAHLDRLGPTRCAEAREGEALLPGRLYLAPGDRHLLVREGPSGLVAALSDGPPENFCRPAVDPMLRSLVAACGGRLAAAILTGMGQDGLAGCREVAATGGLVLAQDEASSVVWGMPGAVARAGLAAALLPVEEIAARLAAAAGGVA
jgi:two-component system chemotaxis response regulator CheB